MKRKDRDESDQSSNKSAQQKIDCLGKLKELKTFAQENPDKIFADLNQPNFLKQFARELPGNKALAKEFLVLLTAGKNLHSSDIKSILQNQSLSAILLDHHLDETLPFMKNLMKHQALFVCQQLIAIREKLLRPENITKNREQVLNYLSIMAELFTTSPEAALLIKDPWSAEDSGDEGGEEVVEEHDAPDQIGSFGEVLAKDQELLYDYLVSGLYPEDSYHLLGHVKDHLFAYIVKLPLAQKKVALQNILIKENPLNKFFLDQEIGDADSHSALQKKIESELAQCSNNGAANTAVTVAGTSADRSEIKVITDSRTIPSMPSTAATVTVTETSADSKEIKVITDLTTNQKQRVSASTASASASASVATNTSPEIPSTAPKLDDGVKTVAVTGTSAGSKEIKVIADLAADQEQRVSPSTASVTTSAGPEIPSAVPKLDGGIKITSERVSDNIFSFNFSAGSNSALPNKHKRKQHSDESSTELTPVSVRPT